MYDECRTSTGLSHGTVLANAPEGKDPFLVDVESRPLPARCAAGCLCVPVPGDLVLLSPPVAGVVYILTVLASNAPTRRMEADRPLVIASTHGLVAVEAPDGIRLTTPGTTTLSAGHILLQGKTVRLLSDLVETAARRVVMACRNALRSVEECEEVEAGSVSFRVRHLLSWRTKVASLISKRLTKIDGDQIQLG